MNLGRGWARGSGFRGTCTGRTEPRTGTQPYQRSHVPCPKTHNLGTSGVSQDRSGVGSQPDTRVSLPPLVPHSTDPSGHVGVEEVLTELRHVAQDLYD